MEASLVHIDLYKDLGEAFSILSTTITLIIFIYHLRSTKKAKVTQFSIFATFVSFGVALILESQLIISIFDPFIHPYCHIARIAIPALYSLWKLILYIVLTIRIHESFGPSSLAHDTRILIFFTVIFTIWSIFNVFFGITSTMTKHTGDEHLRCIIKMDTFLITSAVMLDGTAAIVYT